LYSIHQGPPAPLNPSGHLYLANIVDDDDDDDGGGGGGGGGGVP